MKTASFGSDLVRIGFICVATLLAACQREATTEAPAADASAGEIRNAPGTDGGTSINSIAFESWMEIDMRSGSQAKLDDIDAVLQAAIEQALQEENAARLDGPELTVEVKRVDTRPAAQGDSQSPIVQRAMAATVSYGIEPELRISSTDANLPISKGIPAVTMSRGGVSGGSHSPDEWWQNVDGHVGIQIGLLTLLAEAGMVE